MSSPAHVSAIRYVGIRPRVKQTAAGEAHPTQIVILGPGDFKLSLDLENEQAELDFVLGVFPTSFRKIAEGEDLSQFRDHHIERNDDSAAMKVPAAYEGLKANDLVAMMMGGSGDYLAFALSRKGEEIGATVVHLPAFTLKEKRGNLDTKDDAFFLASLARLEPGIFTPVYVRDRKIVRVREFQKLRIETMKARIGCEQRLRQRYIGQIFCSKDGLFPEGAIEKEFDEQKANDMVLQALNAEENRAKRELEKAVHDTDVWTQVLSQVEGCGPAIAARLISTIQDIRRFKEKKNLKKYLGAHAKGEDGKFPRRRAGQLAGWSNEGRQALYLLADQFNRRPDSVWGQKLLSNKAHYQNRYPFPHLVFTHEDKEKKVVLEPGTFEKKGAKYVVKVDSITVEVTGKQEYFKGHLHKMALWRTSTQFVEWLFAEWWRLEKRMAQNPDTKDSSSENPGQAAA